MISDSNYIVYTAILKNFELLSEMYNETIRLMIFLSETEIQIFELKKSTIKNFNSNSEEVFNFFKNIKFNRMKIFAFIFMKNLKSRKLVLYSQKKHQRI